MLLDACYIPAGIGGVWERTHILDIQECQSQLVWPAGCIRRLVSLLLSLGLCTSRPFRENHHNFSSTKEQKNRGEGRQVSDNCVYSMLSIEVGGYKG